MLRGPLLGGFHSMDGKGLLVKGHYSSLGSE